VRAQKNDAQGSIPKARAPDIESMQTLQRNHSSLQAGSACSCQMPKTGLLPAMKPTQHIGKQSTSLLEVEKRAAFPYCWTPEAGLLVYAHIFITVFIHLNHCCKPS